MGFFKPGKISILMDAQAGSSGKARTASYVAEKHAGKFTFVCNTFSSNAAHWVYKADGRKFMYKALNSCAYIHEAFERMYVGPGSAIEVDDVLKELEENSMPGHKLGIHPLAVVVQKGDMEYEKGLVGFDGEESRHMGTMKTGSTCSGVGAASARRALRRPTTLFAKDVPGLKPFICDVSEEITSRLREGQAGFGEMAQGYQLSLMHPYFAPFTTYRNVTTAAFFSDMMLAPRYLGALILNARTFPIRINSNKYVALDDGHHLIQKEIDAGVPHTVIEGNSGPWYPDQDELTWDDVTQISGSPNRICEITSKTQLNRRVATFSKINLDDAHQANDTGQGVYFTLNFADYVDYSIKGKREITPKMFDWVKQNFSGWGPSLALIGTGPQTEDTIDLGVL